MTQRPNVWLVTFQNWDLVVLADPPHNPKQETYWTLTIVVYVQSVYHECHYRKTSVGHQGKYSLFFMFITSSGILIPIRFVCQALEFYSRRWDTDSTLWLSCQALSSVGSTPALVQNYRQPHAQVSSLQSPQSSDTWKYRPRTQSWCM